MILNNMARAGSGEPLSISIADGRITRVAATLPAESGNGPQLTFVDAMVLPGLINSHDHLDFNLFPQLGNRTYSNYTEWGPYIQQAFADEIASVMRIPFLLRERWGLYKNLLCGVTTVVNHSHIPAAGNDLISVYEKCQTLHSVKFEPRWKKRLNNPFRVNQAVAIHVGEGTDAKAQREIDELIKWNLLRRKLVGIHGVSMSPRQAAHFKALVWCPQSNHFLLNATARVKDLKKHTRILFGTDSTLTSGWNIWEHIRTARQTGMLTDEELFQSFTTNPARTWKLNTGQIGEGFDADLVIAKTNSANNMDAFYQLNPDDILLVIHKGNIRLFDEMLYHQLTGTNVINFGKIFTGNSFKYVQGDVAGLIKEIKQYKTDAAFPVHIPFEPAPE